MPLLHWNFTNKSKIKMLLFYPAVTYRAQLLVRASQSFVVAPVTQNNINQQG